MIHIKKKFPEKTTPQDTDLICYCFGYTKKDIEEDYITNNGHSTILEKIMAEKRAGQCACAQKNPHGR